MFHIVKFVKIKLTPSNSHKTCLVYVTCFIMCLIAYPVIIKCYMEIFKEVLLFSI